jgi:hypothetical protein
MKYVDDNQLVKVELVITRGKLLCLFNSIEYYMENTKSLVAPDLHSMLCKAQRDLI